MPTILYRSNPGITTEDIARIAIFANHVGRDCFDEFGDDGSRRRSDSLSGKVQDLMDALGFEPKALVIPDIAKTVVALQSHVNGYCFDKFGDRGHMGKTMDLLRMTRDVGDVLDKMVIFKMSAEEEDDAELERAHDVLFHAG